MKIKKVFNVCPICDGTGEILNYNVNNYNEIEIMECTNCYHGIIIKDKWYDKIINKLGIKNVFE